MKIHCGGGRKKVINKPKHLCLYCPNDCSGPANPPSTRFLSRTFLNKTLAHSFHGRALCEQQRARTGLAKESRFCSFQLEDECSKKTRLWRLRFLQVLLLRPSRNGCERSCRSRGAGQGEKHVGVPVIIAERSGSASKFQMCAKPRGLAHGACRLTHQPLGETVESPNALLQVMLKISFLLSTSVISFSLPRQEQLTAPSKGNVLN